MKSFMFVKTALILILISHVGSYFFSSFQTSLIIKEIKKLKDKEQNIRDY